MMEMPGKLRLVRCAMTAAFILTATLTTGAAQAPRLGIGMECLDRDLWNHKPAIPHLKELGIKRVRLQSGWARTEKTKGVYDFAWLDEIVNDLTAAGVEPWISLSYGNPLYALPEEGPQAYTGQQMYPLRSEEGKAAWLTYVRAIVGRYRDHVRIWEVWNEPDGKVFLAIPPGTNWVDEYVRLARLTAEAVREVQPTARVALCTGGGPCLAESHCHKLLSRNVEAFADIYAFHGYIALPEAFSADKCKAFYASVRARAPKIELWRGEAGISSQRSGQGALCELPLSEEMQARWMTRHLVRDLADPEISFTSYFHLFDFRHFNRKVTYHYGVLRDGDYSRKPSFEVLKRIRCFLDDGAATPDGTYSLLLSPEKDATAVDQAIVAGAAVYPFRRNGLPLFAVTSVWPATEEMKPVQVSSEAFRGTMYGPLTDPVLFDLVTGEVQRLDSAMHFSLANHVKLIAEADALAPYVRLERRTVDGSRDSGPTVQRDGE